LETSLMKSVNFSGRQEDEEFFARNFCWVE